MFTAPSPMASIAFSSVFTLIITLPATLSKKRFPVPASFIVELDPSCPIVKSAALPKLTV